VLRVVEADESEGSTGSARCGTGGRLRTSTCGTSFMYSLVYADSDASPHRPRSRRDSRCSSMGGRSRSRSTTSPSIWWQSSSPTRAATCWRTCSPMLTTHPALRADFPRLHAHRPRRVARLLRAADARLRAELAPRLTRSPSPWRCSACSTGSVLRHRVDEERFAASRDWAPPAFSAHRHRHHRGRHRLRGVRQVDRRDPRRPAGPSSSPASAT